jgi:hypothetical protein
MIQKAANRIIELHDDNPIYLQIIVKFCYTLEQDAPPRINLDFHNEIFENKYFAPIGVQALTDKYDIPGMHVCIALAFPNPGRDIYKIKIYKKLAVSYYEYRVARNC